MENRQIFAHNATKEKIGHVSKIEEIYKIPVFYKVHNQNWLNENKTSILFNIELIFEFYSETKLEL